MRRLLFLFLVAGCSRTKQSQEYRAHVVKAAQFAELRPIGQQCPTAPIYDDDGRDKSGGWRWDTVAPIGAKLQQTEGPPNERLLYICTLTGWSKDTPEEEEYLRQAMSLPQIVAAVRENAAAMQK